MRGKVILIKSIILYGSHYGSSRRYAQKLSEQTNIPAVCYKDTPSLSDKNPIIYLGSMYAGGILELKKTLHGFSLRDRQKLILVTVNLSDPELQENQKNIRRSLQKQLPAELYNKAKIFHLQGPINYQKLSLLHQTMMLHRSLQNKSAEKWNKEDQAFIETYDKQGDFVEFDALQPIIDEIKKDITA